MIFVQVDAENESNYPAAHGHWHCRLSLVPGIMSLFDPCARESPAIPKQRKPPSQRPERQLDDTARAIARLAEEAKAEKSPEARKSGPKENASLKRQAPPAINGMGQRKVGGGAPTISTKRPKTGGA